MNTLEEAIAVLLAIKDGEEIERRDIGGKWWDSIRQRKGNEPFVDWAPNFCDCEYRVVQKPIVAYANVYPSGGVALYPDEDTAKYYSAGTTRTVKLVEEE